VSRQAVWPNGVFGRLLGRIWLTETAAVNDVAVELLAPARGERVCEIGFGPGRTLALLAAAGAEVTGVEVSPAMVQTATHRNAKAIAAGAISLHLGDGTTLPLPDDSLDAVLSVHNFYFWPQPRVTLADIARTLRTGGRLVVTSLGADYPLPARPGDLPRAHHRRRHGMAARGGLRRCRRTTQATHRHHRVAHRNRGVTRKRAADLQPRLRGNPWRPCPSG